MSAHTTQHVDRRFGHCPFVCPGCQDDDRQRQTVLAFQAQDELLSTDYEIGCEACGLIYAATVHLRGSDGPPTTPGPARECCPACDGTGLDGAQSCSLCGGEAYIWASEFGGGPEMRGQERLLDVKPARQPQSSTLLRFSGDGGQTWQSLEATGFKIICTGENVRPRKRKRAQKARRGRRGAS